MQTPATLEQRKLAKREIIRQVEQGHQLRTPGCAALSPCIERRSTGYSSECKAKARVPWSRDDTDTRSNCAGMSSPV